MSDSDFIRETGSERASAPERTFAAKAKTENVQRAATASERVKYENKKRDQVIISKEAQRREKLLKTLKDSSEVRPDVTKKALAELKANPLWPVQKAVKEYFQELSDEEQKKAEDARELERVQRLRNLAKELLKPLDTSDAKNFAQGSTSR